MRTVDPPELQYELRRSRRARRITLRVSPGRGLVVSAPEHATRTQIEATVEAHGEWARRTLCDAERALPEACREWPPRRLELAAIGQRVVIGFEPAGSSVGSQAPTGPSMDGAGSDPVLALSIDPADRMAVSAAVSAWLRPLARRHLEPRLAAFAERHGVVYRRCSIRAQRSVWGSCSTSGTLSLNCKLLFLAPELVDYVLLHELAHTRHPDHSPRFWRQLECWLSGARGLDQRLRRAARHVPPWLERVR